jgi:GDP-L-fucose synthase
LRNQEKVFKFFKKNEINSVINAAGTVGGIYANNVYGGKFIYENLQIQNNLIHSSYLNKIKNAHWSYPLYVVTHCETRNPL